MNKALEVFEIATKHKPVRVVVDAEFIQIPGMGGGLYKVDNGELLSPELLTIDCHGNYYLKETLAFHATALKNGQIVEVTIQPETPYACDY